MGNYTLGRLIGKGSFGKVYLASHKLTNGSKVREVEIRYLSVKIDISCRSSLSPLKRMMPILREKFIITDNSYIPILLDCMRLS